MKIPKCVIIPIAEAFSQSLVDRISSWLSTHLPTWTAVRISGHGTLLGIVVGPAAGLRSWDKPLIKMKRRIADVAATSAPPSVAVAEYNTRVMPCASYVSQFLPPPSDAVRTEWSFLHKLLKVSPGVFTWKAFFVGMHEIGLQPLRSFVINGLACALRYIVKTVPQTKQYIDMLTSNDERSLYAFAHEVLGAQHFEPTFLECAHDIFRSKFLDRRFRKAMLAGSTIALNPDSLNKPNMQKRIYDSMVQNLPGKGLLPLLQERFQLHFRTPFLLDFCLLSDKKFKKQIPPCVRWSIVKSLLGGWSTCTRLREQNDFGCIFGCPECLDAWPHYSHCDRLWGVVNHVCSVSLDVCREPGEDDHFRGMFQQLILLEKGCLAIHIAFKLYHHLRAERVAANTSLTFDDADQLLITASSLLKSARE